MLRVLKRKCGKVVTTHKTIVTKQPISSLEEMLPKDAFIRIHRSYIIAINKIESFNADSIEIGKKELPVGRLFKHDVARLLNLSAIRFDGEKSARAPGNNRDKEIN